LRRSQATRRIEDVLRRVLPGGPYASRVSSLYINGSYARGALEVGDIDLVVEFEQSDWERVCWVNDALAGRRNRYLEFERELRGDWRSVDVLFNFAETLIALGWRTLKLWERGDSLETALDRLRAMAPDAQAGRAHPYAAPPAIVGLDRFVSRPDASLLRWLTEGGSLAVERVRLPDQEPGDRTTRARIERHLGGASRKRRAVCAVAGHLEQQGTAPLQIGRALRSEARVGAPLADGGAVAEVVVHLGARLIASAADDLARGSRLAIVVVNPWSQKAPLVALALTAPLGGERFARDYRDLLEGDPRRAFLLSAG
jgi:hypothetical protein